MIDSSTGYKPLILASASPRRRDLLGQLGIPFVVRPVDVDETLDADLPLAEAVAGLAERKARAAGAGLNRGLVLGADTVVVLDAGVLGKPRDEADAVRMLRLLRNRSHEVVTGVALVDVACDRRERSAVRSVVRLRGYSDAEIDAYVATGEPLDKAGGYAIQGIGGALVAAVDGCYANVVGLPLCEVGALLARFGRPIVSVQPICLLPTGDPCPRLDSLPR